MPHQTLIFIHSDTGLFTLGSVMLYGIMHVYMLPLSISRFRDCNGAQQPLG